MFGDEKSTTALREVLMFAIGNFAFPSVEHVNAKCGRQMENNFGEKSILYRSSSAHRLNCARHQRFDVQEWSEKT